MRLLNTTIAATAALAIVSVANAAEPTFRTAAIAQPDADMLRRLEAVCQPSAFVLTADARNACLTGEFPQLIGNGTGFRNAGIGAEFNALMRQVPTAAATVAAQ